MDDAARQRRAHSKLEAEREMKRLARAEGTTTYSDLAGRLTTRYAPMGKPFAALLSEISEKSYRRDGVLLSAVVVHASDGIPGDGFFELAERLQLDVADRREFWRQALESLYRRVRAS